MMDVGHLSHHVVVGPGSHMGLESGASKHFRFHFPTVKMSGNENLALSTPSLLYIVGEEED